MALPVTTVASGGLPVVDVTATTPKLGLPVTETTRGTPVTKVAAGKPGLAAVYVTDTGGGGGGSDPDFSSVVLLAGFNGTDGAATYTAETGQVLGISGASRIKATQAKFGTTSFGCDNTSVATFPPSAAWDLSLANSDQFTIEWWQWLPGLANTVAVLQVGYNANGFLIRANTTTFEFFWIDSAGGNNSMTFPATGFTANQWDACCLEKNSSGLIRWYLNGVMKTSQTPANSTIKVSSSQLLIGPSIPSAIAYVDEIRFSKGKARYNAASYTVQTAPFPRS